MTTRTPSTTEKRADARRVVSILDRSLAGPVASVWTTHLFGGTSSRAARQSDDAHSARSITFTLSRTEDAMDSVLPCAAEEFFRPMLQTKFGNPAKMKFYYPVQG